MSTITAACAASSTQADVKSGKVKIIAPEHFTEHAVSENVIAGNVMSRRAIYMYGALLPRNAQRWRQRRPGADHLDRQPDADRSRPTSIKKTGEEA